MYAYFHFKQFSDIINVVLIFLAFSSYNQNFRYRISRSKRCTTYILIYTPFPKPCFPAINREDHIHVSLASIFTFDKIIKFLLVFLVFVSWVWGENMAQTYLRSFDKRNATVIRRQIFQSQARNAQNQKSTINSRLRKLTLETLSKC